MASGGSDNTKQLRIQTGVVKRLAKEKKAYEKELELNTSKVEKMREAGKDESDINQAIKVLDETSMMIPDTEKRLTEAYHTLEDLVKASGDLQVSTEYKEAAEVLEANKSNISP